MATLTVSVKEELVINGKDRGNTNSISIDNVTELFSRVVTITSTENDILNFQASTAKGSTLVDGTLQYLRITNISDSNFVNLRFQDIANEKEFSVRITGSESFVLYNDVLDTNEGSDLSASISFSQLEKISAVAPSGTPDIEIFAVAT